VAFRIDAVEQRAQPHAATEAQVCGYLACFNPSLCPASTTA
jgi:hypothetical protein